MPLKAYLQKTMTILKFLIKLHVIFKQCRWSLNPNSKKLISNDELENFGFR